MTLKQAVIVIGVALMGGTIGGVAGWFIGMWVQHHL